MELQEIKGLGPKNIKLLNKLGIFSINDLINYYPYRYNKIETKSLMEHEDFNKIVVKGIVSSIPTISYIKRKMNSLRFKADIDGKLINIVIFNRSFLKPHLTINKQVIILGKYDQKRNTIIASDIKLDINLDNKVESIYHCTTGISSKTLNNYINQALKCVEVDDYIPSYLKERYSFIDKDKSLLEIHNPEDESILKKALIRLKYEELFIFMLKMERLREQNKEENEYFIRNINEEWKNEFIKQIPFELTEDQVKAIDDITIDLNSPRRMNRLIQGDVGSGKTIVGFAACYLMAKANYQSALMVPTEILANQHYNNMKKILPLRVELLTGTTTKSKKEEIYNKLMNNEIDVIIGTHALLNEQIEFNNLGLVITDEQHRFGVNQRHILRNKGQKPDVLYMSATPIPRTYALTIYKDMDITSIKTLPKGRKKVTTYLKKYNEIKEVLSMIYEQLKQSNQIFVVAPLIEENDSSNMESVMDLKEKLQKAFKNYNIDIIHGKMKNKDKDIIMNEFKENKINILISTTVIEVGIDIPNATMMVIFDASRFGLSTLHQLRGRVGRGEKEGTCILISNSEHERLKVMTTTNDGFEISENDFKLRGHGDLFGVKQHGDMIFKIASLKNDYKILMQTKEDANEFIETKNLYDYKNISDEIDKINNQD